MASSFKLNTSTEPDLPKKPFERYSCKHDFEISLEMQIRYLMIYYISIDPKIVC